MRTVPSSDVRGWARRAGFIALAVLCVTSMLATAASAQPVVAKKKPKPKSPSAGSLSSALAKGAKGSFSVTYLIKVGAVSGTYTYSQKPPDYTLTFSSKEGTVEVFLIGKSAYDCVSVAGTNICTKESASTVAPELDLIQPVDQSAKIKAFVAGAKGIKLSTSTFAKQASTCAAGRYGGVKTTYCVTSGGFLAYAGTKAGSLSLTGYGGTPPTSAFALPAGAKIVG
ncbi:MAG TPA: hypothetical protein VED84_08560 [Acidimicrobiales bacterium]|nr:hypothetical protein [Acidimicrobiales bacterium]